MADWEDYESGPFCPHYADVWECEELCKCGHQCCKHYSECSELGCKCERFEDAEDVLENTGEKVNERTITKVKSDT